MAIAKLAADPMWESRLRPQLVEVAKLLSPRRHHLSAHLFSAGLINSDEQQRFTNSNKDDTSMALEILEILRNQAPESFDKFCNVLVKVNDDTIRQIEQSLRPAHCSDRTLVQNINSVQFLVEEKLIERFQRSCQSQLTACLADGLQIPEEKIKTYRRCMKEEFGQLGEGVCRILVAEKALITILVSGVDKETIEPHVDAVLNILKSYGDVRQDQVEILQILDTKSCLLVVRLPGLGMTNLMISFYSTERRPFLLEQLRAVLPTSATNVKFKFSSLPEASASLMTTMTESRNSPDISRQVVPSLQSDPGSAPTWEVYCDGSPIAKGTFDPSRMLTYNRGDCIRLEDGTWVTMREFYFPAYSQPNPNWKRTICAGGDAGNKKKIAHILDATRKRLHRDRCTCKRCKEWKQSKTTAKTSKKADSTSEPPTKKQKIEKTVAADLESMIEKIDERQRSGDEGTLQSVKYRLGGLRNDLQMLKQELSRLMKDEILVIGFEGSCGVGKSSLLNAILKQEDLLPVNSCQSGTVTPIQIHSSDGVEDYKARVEFVTENDWHKELKMFCVLAASAESGDVTEDDLAAKEIVTSKVQAVYGSRIDLDGENYTFEYLSTLKNGVTKQLQATESQETEALEFTAKTGKELRRQIGPYITTTLAATESEGEYWPIVKAVTITIPTTEILPPQVVLVDLPGISDSCEARRDATEKFIKHCNRRWLVVDINRCTADKSFEQLVGLKQYRQLKLDGLDSKLVVIATKTDAERNLKQDIEFFRMEKEVEGKNQDERKLVVAKRRNEYTKDNVIRSLRRRQRQVPSSGRSTTAGVDSVTASSSSSAEVVVFTVSSADYLSIKDPEAAAHVYKDEIDTEIPKLQQYLRAEYKIARDSALNRWTGFAELVQEMPEHKGPESDKQRTFVRTKCEELKTKMEKSVEDANKQFKDSASACLKLLDNHLKEGVKAAKSNTGRAVKSLTKVRVHTLRAVCLRDGEFPAAKKGTMKISFNSDLAEPIMKEIEQAWEQIFDKKKNDSSLYQAATHAAKQMESEFSEHLKKLEADLESEKIPPLELEQIQKRWQLELDDRTERLRDIIATEQKKAYRRLQPSIQHSLKPTYKAAAAFKKEGAQVKMYQKITTGVREASDRDDPSGMFEKAAAAVQSQIKDSLVSRLQESIREFGNTLCSLNVFQHLWQDPGEARLFKKACEELGVQPTMEELLQSITKTDS